MATKLSFEKRVKSLKISLEEKSATRSTGGWTGASVTGGLIFHRDLEKPDSNFRIVGQNLFCLQREKCGSFDDWGDCGFRGYYSEGTVPNNTEFAVSALIGGNYKLPKGAELVSAVYAISVSQQLLKPLTIELQHCVDLRYEGQARRLKFARAPLKYPYQFSILEGGSFSVGNRYGSIALDLFCVIGIVQYVSNNDDSTSDSDSDDEQQDIQEDHESTDWHGEGSDEDGVGQTQLQQGAAAGAGVQAQKQAVSDVQEGKEVSGGPDGSSNGSSNGSSDGSIHGSESSDEELGEEEACTSMTSPINQRSNRGHSPKLDQIWKGDTIYFGKLYYEKRKEDASWENFYTVVKDLDVLKKYLKSDHPNANECSTHDFKFLQPEGILTMCLKVENQEGWIVEQTMNPMKISQETVDNHPLYLELSTQRIYIYAEPIARKPLHFSIEMDGIDTSPLKLSVDISPPKIQNPVNVNRPSPLAPPQNSSFRGDIAHKAMTECTGMIKDYGIDNVHFLVDKLLEHKIISERKKKEITDGYTRQTAGERMDELLHIISSTIKRRGGVFGIFLEILKEEDTIRTVALAEDLMEKYVSLERDL